MAQKRSEQIVMESRATPEGRAIMFRMGKDTKQCSDSWTPFHFSLTATEGRNNPLGGVPPRTCHSGKRISPQRSLRVGFPTDCGGFKGVSRCWRGRYCNYGGNLAPG